MLSDFQRKVRLCLAIAMLLVLSSCAITAPSLELPPAVESRRLNQLDQSIQALGTDINPAESKRAANIAIQYSRTLAQEYDLIGSPLFHNLMVQIGLRKRGLCIDWTTDLMARLRQENFRSLELHRAIANYETLFQFEHSSVIVSARGSSIEQGLVLDPWRNSGQLFWAPTLLDKGYRWKPRAEVLKLKRINQAAAEKKTRPGTLAHETLARGSLAHKRNKPPPSDHVVSNRNYQRCSLEPCSVFNHRCMILSFPQLEVETYALEDQEIVRCWRFSMLRS